MKITLVLLALTLMCACGQTPQANYSPASRTTVASPTPATSATGERPKDGDYPAKGVVTKINMESASVELDHEDVPGLMPPMRMEFFVTDMKMLEGLKVGDKVDFVLKYKDPTETIVKITKAK